MQLMTMHTLALTYAYSGVPNKHEVLLTVYEEGNSEVIKCVGLTS